MKTRKPEWDRRDLLFVHECEKCSRAWRCSFKTSLEGPEAVCKRLISEGGYNCESCIRRNVGGGCTFTCVFFKAKIVKVPEKRDTSLPPREPPSFNSELHYLLGNGRRRN